jgi:hypothetical protein
MGWWSMVPCVPCMLRKADSTRSRRRRLASTLVASGATPGTAGGTSEEVELSARVVDDSMLVPATPDEEEGAAWMWWDAGVVRTHRPREEDRLERCNDGSRVLMCL